MDFQHYDKQELGILGLDGNQVHHHFSGHLDHDFPGASPLPSGSIHLPHLHAVTTPFLLIKATNARRQHSHVTLDPPSQIQNPGLTVRLGASRTTNKAAKAQSGKSGKLVRTRTLVVSILYEYSCVSRE
jgi:hypothetical protein